MIASMTGYGRSKVSYNGKNISIEIKSLNSKQFDLSLRIPGFYREKEPEIRDMISTSLQRGKVDFALYVELTGKENSLSFNKEAASFYIKQMTELCNEHGIVAGPELVASSVGLPDVMQSNNETLSDAEWLFVKNTCSDVIQHVVEFRENEGKTIGKDIMLHLSKIEELTSQVEPFETERTVKIREKLWQQMNDLPKQTEIDTNRLEQELIFYFEKLDITEEKVRLKKHCDYFRCTFETEDNAGKKLGFVCQEIGREINTLGSKANHSEIQILVVQMKDELEKIKEQLLNIL